MTKRNVKFCVKKCDFFKMYIDFLHIFWYNLNKEVFMSILEKLSKKNEPFVEFKYDESRDAYKIFALRDFGRIKAGQAGGYIKMKRGTPERIVDGQVWISANTIVYADTRSRMKNGAFIYARNSGNGRIVGTSIVLNNSTLDNVEMHLQFLSEDDSLNIVDSELRNVTISKTLDRGCNAYIKSSKINDCGFIATGHSHQLVVKQAELKGVMSYGQNIGINQSKVISNNDEGRIILANDINVVQSRIHNVDCDVANIASEDNKTLSTNASLERGKYTVNANATLDRVTEVCTSKIASVDNLARV